MEKIESFLQGKVFYNIVTLTFALVMLGGGTINTILFKAQDLQYVKGLGDGPPKPFEHPFTQGIFMFFGMAICLLVYYPVQLVRFGYKKIFQQFKKSKEPTLLSNDAKNIDSGNEKGDFLPDEGHASYGSIQAEEKKTAKKVEKKKRNEAPFWVFILPATFDLLATALMNVGLIFVQSSVFAMLRGSVIIFSCIASVILLKDQRYLHHWISVVGIFVGACIVGLSSIMRGGNNKAARNPALGIAFITFSQILQALQMVFEEIFLSRYDTVPLQVAGWQGFWGIWVTGLFVFTSYWIPGSDYGSAESFPYAVAQLIHSPFTFMLCSGSVFGCFLLNYAGVTLTSRLNNTARGTIDSLRTFAIWMISLLIRWESFDWMQVLGFGVMLCFTFIYNGILSIPYYTTWFDAKLASDRKKRAEGKKVPTFVDWILDYINYGVLDADMPEETPEDSEDEKPEI